MEKTNEFGWTKEKSDKIYSFLDDRFNELGKNKQHELQDGLAFLMHFIDSQKFQEPKIYLKFNNACIREHCAITGESFKPDIPLAFFLNNDHGLPVLPEIAFKCGFIMDEKEFHELEGDVLCGINSPKRKEFDTTKDLPF